MAPPWRLRPQGSDTAWAIAFVVPYAAVFAAFVVYPVGVRPVDGQRSDAVHGLLFSDPHYPTTASNTLLFVAIGVNVKMFLAFLLSGFFMSRSWWVRSLLAMFLLPWALPSLTVFLSIHYMLVSQLAACSTACGALSPAATGRCFWSRSWIAMAANIVSYIWKWMPFWTLIFIAARMAIPQDVYEAAEIDGATGYRRLIYVTFPLLANVYLVCTLLSTLWTLGDFPTVVFRFLRRTGAADRCAGHLWVPCRHSISAIRSLGVAAVMSALPVLIPAIILLMRRVRLTGVQL